MIKYLYKKWTKLCLYFILVWFSSSINVFIYILNNIWIILKWKIESKTKNIFFLKLYILSIIFYIYYRSYNETKSGRTIKFSEIKVKKYENIVIFLLLNRNFLLLEILYFIVQLILALLKKYYNCNKYKFVV